jgi:hypothetical protein
MAMVMWKFLHPAVTWEHLGYLPQWLDDNDPRPASQQFDAGYKYGGGWTPLPGQRLTGNNWLTYPGDPPLIPLAEARLRDELILFYDHAWVVIVQPDRSYQVSRMD